MRAIITEVLYRCHLPGLARRLNPSPIMRPRLGNERPDTGRWA